MRLTDLEREELHQNYLHLTLPDTPQSDHDGFVSQAAKWVTENAPSRICEEIVRWKSDPHGSGVLVIDNLGVDSNLPQTPVDGRPSPDKLTNYSEVLLTGIGMMLGEVFCFEAERDGMMVQDLTPVRGKESSLTNEGTNLLGWHTEHSATGYVLPGSPSVISYLAFIGLRSDPTGRAKTLVADIRDAARLISSAHMAELRSDQFLVRPPLMVRARISPPNHQVSGVPIITGPDSSPEIRVALYGDMVEGLTDDAKQALAALQRALDRVHRGFETQPGRLMLVDNRVALHARAPYQPKYDGRDRWLQRLLVTDSLWPFRSWQQNANRVLTP
ncbi:MAG: TauD/TfdA family dioxygenase [Planctomycetota bacterium]